ncbi:hypothetical protein EHE19_018075 [Ruminiclostridium herbifermentans]|uniref:Uncharacterized protein n=1 Tax=Ruminiclostridium herbifermentans TaxID=2488810 RepID=A0A4U7JKF0_9FIRM|nr:hypothetical protein [Ruminiclostridium herbifermentans]QNU66722.1 hypothetical protein EHE19_018075 [Ruminiclostridium herbifermentans]
MNGNIEYPIIRIIEADDNEANQLLESGLCQFIDTYKKSTHDYEFPQDTYMVYCIGQNKYGVCSECNENMVKYVKEKWSNKIRRKCKACGAEEYLIY